MHIAIDAANLPHDRRGIGRYVRAVVTRWLRQPDRVKVTLLVPGLFPSMAKDQFSRALANEHVDVARRGAVTRLAPGVVWYPWNGMTWVSPRSNVATVHDVWPFVSPSSNADIRRREQTAYLTMAANTKRIIANSQFTKSELVHYLPVESERVSVVHMGVDRAAPVPSVRIEGADRYVLFVGEAEPRKDPATLLAAFAKLPEALRHTTGLVMAGKTSNSAQRHGAIETQTAANSKSNTVLHFERTDTSALLVSGEVNESTLQELYASAAIFAFPSRYEGFGLPVLEAMARGVPVVASQAASVPEVAGDAACYFPPGDTDALASALTQLLTDAAVAQELRERGFARAASLSWDRCADQTLEVFQSMMESAPL